MDILGGTDGLTTAGANILAGAAGLLLLRGIVWIISGAADGQLISPMLGGTEGFQRRGRLGDRVTNFGVIVNQQAPLFGFFLEAFVVVGIATTGVLNTVQLTKVRKATAKFRKELDKIQRL